VGDGIRRGAEHVPQLGPAGAAPDLRGLPLRDRRLSTTPVPDAFELAARLEDLPVRIEAVEAYAFPAPAAGYGDAPRPASRVTLRGGGVEGAGECVAWSAADQARFAAGAGALVGRGSLRLADVAARLGRDAPDPYWRAALEMAAADLALRQAGTNPFRLAGVAPRPARVLLSFGTLDDPVHELERVLGPRSRAALKLDVAPAWTAATLAALGAAGRVRVMDLKRRGDLALAERVHAHVPGALVEDPALAPGETVSASLSRRISFDAPVRRAADVGALPLAPAAVNVKPSRMGGLLEALRAFAECRMRGIRAYVGGMFEVGPGRPQLQVLAALFAPDEWNDVAPLRAAGDAAGREEGFVAIPSEFDGFGFTTRPDASPRAEPPPGRAAAS
jgi:L-alanine-DL-glutamate epimerase-like enolase superfamily enzyme